MTGKFKGVKLKENMNMKEEIWNGYTVFTVEAADVDYIVSEHSKANDNEVSRIFHLPSRSFEVSIVRIYRLCGKMQPVLEPVSQTATKPTTSYSIGRLAPSTLQATSPLTM